MLTVLLVSKTLDFYHCDLDKTPIVVCPNPQTADLVRKNFENAQRKVESVTISRFIKDELISLIEENQLQNFRGKSELNLLLGAIWKRIGQDGDYVSFKKAFNLLTELRSFSMSDQVFEAVLEHYDKTLGDTVLLMHRLLEEMNILDEHKSYFLLSERLRAGDIPPEKEMERVIVFYGFDFMTASQVDLIKSMGLRDDVYIPVYKKAYESTSQTDWIRWFDEYNLEIKDISSGDLPKPLLRFETFSKGYFSKKLMSKGYYNYCVLGTKNLNAEFAQEVPLNNIAYKFDIDLFSEEMGTLLEAVENFVQQTNEISALRKFLQDYMKRLIENQKFRLLKATMIFLSKLNDWESLSSENTTCGTFELEILFESARLDCPRVNATSLASEHTHTIKALGHLDEIKGGNALLGIHERHQSVKGINANYSEGVEKYLASIGPIRRADFEVGVFKERLKEFVLDNEVLLVIENGILEHDTHWSSIFEEFSLEQTDSSDNTTELKELPVLPKSPYVLESISASKLQRYYDCPQKFYFQYAEKLLPRIEFHDEILPMELGNLEHKTIELYFKQYFEYKEDAHEELIHKLLNSSLTVREVTRELAQEYFIEIKAFTKDIILRLIDLRDKLHLKIEFEVPFKIEKDGLKYTGSIDCFLSNPELSIILDFKRGNSLFTSFSGIQDYDQLQLWFYLQRLEDSSKISKNETLNFGYINLSDIESSMLFTNDKDQVETLKKDFLFTKVKFIEALADHISKYQELENNLINDLRSDKEFLPRPRKVQVCDYCDLKNICSRGINGIS